MDAASSEWKGSKKGEYKLPKCGKVFTSEELVEHWKQLVEKYPIYPSRTASTRRTGRAGST